MSELDLSTRLHREETLAALEEFEASLVEHELVPDARKLMTRRFAPVLEFLGALALGALIAATSVLLSFYVFNVVLHL